MPAMLDGGVINVFKGNVHTILCGRLLCVNGNGIYKLLGCLLW